MEIWIAALFQELADMRQSALSNKNFLRNEFAAARQRFKEGDQALERDTLDSLMAPLQHLTDAAQAGGTAVSALASVRQEFARISGQDGPVAGFGQWGEMHALNLAGLPQAAAMGVYGFGRQKPETAALVLPPFFFSKNYRTDALSQRREKEYSDRRAGDLKKINQRRRLLSFPTLLFRTFFVVPFAAFEAFMFAQEARRTKRRDWSFRETQQKRLAKLLLDFDQSARRRGLMSDPQEAQQETRHKQRAELIRREIAEHWTTLEAECGARLALLETLSEESLQQIAQEAGYQFG